MCHSPAGKVSVSKGSTTCSTCAVNEVAPLAGSAACARCPSTAKSSVDNSYCLCNSVSRAVQLVLPAIAYCLILQQGWYASNQQEAVTRNGTGSPVNCGEYFLAFYN